MLKRMTFARWIFLIAGVYGILVIVPLYFMEAQVNEMFPPALTHPEYYYGFLSVTLAWQIAFLIMSVDPSRYRLLIIPSVMEKWLHVFGLIVLYYQGRVTLFQASSGGVDFLLGALFLAVFLRSRNRLVTEEHP